VVSSQQVFVAELNTGALSAERGNAAKRGITVGQEVRTPDYGIPAPRRVLRIRNIRSGAYCAYVTGKTTGTMFFDFIKSK